MPTTASLITQLIKRGIASNEQFTQVVIKIEVDCFLPRMGRPVKFVATGKVVHDDKTDWTGTFVNMTDANDKLEMDDEIAEQNTVQNRYGYNWYLWQMVYLQAGESITKLECLMQTASGTKSGNIELRATKGGAALTYASYYATTTVAWVGGECTPYTIPSSGTYWLMVDCRTNLRWYFADTNPYRGTAYYMWYNSNYNTSWDQAFKIWKAKPTGSYEHDTIPVDVGVGVDWGKISWTEVLDGATLDAKVKTSPDNVDWSESWQTLNSGDYITGNNRYLKYGFWLINGTGLTELDNVEIEYAL